MRCDNRLRDVHGCSCNRILRKRARDGSFLLGINYSNVKISALLDTGFDTCRLKSLRIGNAHLCTCFAKHIYSSVHLRNHSTDT